ncbi:sensor histidine kinase [Peredibacter starrii]|uniref:histidine kinase n=1 Tax=Peredibacter starrii TaxID=28202 RepID=A0AAX4HJQ3_9BACT|nr:ATP-binding protein [Peredibacter starrii]WPU63443.1 ATP-binding protein [Peredibacter starrii]
MGHKLKEFVEKRLIGELRVRNKRLMVPHVALIILSVLLLFKTHQTHPLTFVPYVIIIFSLLMRIYISSKKELALRKDKFYYCAFLFFVATTGLSWSWMFWQVEAIHGFFAVESLYCLGVIITLMAGGVTAFAASLTVAAVFFTSVSVLPVAFFFTDTNHASLILGSLYLINLIYQFYHTTISRRYLIESIVSEARALEQKDALQEFIDAIPGIVGFVDRNATYVMLNNFLDGTVKNKILGTKVGTTLPNNPLSKLILDFLKSEEKHIVKEMYAEDLTGENWYMVNLKKVSSPLDGILAVVLPINDLVKAKNDLRIQEARSQYASRLASLGELSAGIAHEVNNPLTIIEGAANLMKIIIKDTPEDVASLDLAANKVIDTSQRIAKIIKSLRTLSTDAEEEPFKNVSFDSIIEPIIEISKGKLDSAGIKLRVIKSESDVALFGNEIQLSQVIMNLIANSIDAVQELNERWIEIHYQPNFEWCDILVVDSGNGIPPELHARLMEPFYTTKEAHQGTGLGLSISKNIIEIHHGTLSVMKDSKNTTFRVRLPRMNPWGY